MSVMFNFARQRVVALESQNKELREALTETRDVIDAMFNEDKFPPTRLAPRLMRLLTIVRKALEYR
jgi:hypothetical protein